MRKGPPLPRVLSYDDLRRAADAFLDKYWPEKTIPVDIEDIVDVRLGIHIVPEPELDQETQVESLLSSDLSTIWVGDIDFQHETNRYRFTLAHEAGHWYLHRLLYEGGDYTTVSGWKSYVRGISDEDYSWYEWQANSFAGLALVQEQPLEEWVNRAREKALARDFDLDFDIEAHCEFAAEYISKQFEVSSQVIMRRGEKDGFWAFR